MNDIKKRYTCLKELIRKEFGLVREVRESFPKEATFELRPER